MQEICAALLALDCLYGNVSMAEYKQERQKVEVQIQCVLPGFTIAYAVEIGTVGAGEGISVHGGVAHVFLPLRELER